MANGLDYAGGIPGGAAIAAAGYRFVCRYLSSGGSALPSKMLTPAEADDLRANGIEIVSNWETTGEEMLNGGYRKKYFRAISRLTALARDAKGLTENA